MRDLIREFGLDHFPPIYRDHLFLLAVLSGILYWGALWGFFPEKSFSWGRFYSWGFFLLVVWQPFLEELFFRGAIQGQLYRLRWGSPSILGFSIANGLTTFLFAFAHWFYQSSPWMIGVIVPSLVFGFFRDRYSNIYPSFILHAYYNAGFFFLMGIPKAT
jgi:membrane protease YdiL (CAAX protease family)